MPWVRLDDQRAMHRKLRAAGFAARGLDEAAICQAAADRTDGFVATDTVEMLAAAHREKQWSKLVATLVEVGRWTPTEGGWSINGFLDYNPSAAEWDLQQAKKRSAGRRGGQARAQADATARAQADPNQTPERVLDPRGEANAQADPTRPDPKSPPPPVVTHEGCGKPVGGGGLFDQAIETLAQRQMAAANGTVRNPSGWLARARTSLTARYGPIVETLDLTAFDTPEKLADRLEPPPPPPPAIRTDFAVGSGYLENWSSR